jgi:flagellar protein FlaG
MKRSKNEAKMDIAISNINPAGSNTAPQREPSAQTSEECIPMSPEASKQLIQAIQSQLQSMNVSLSFSKYGKNGDDIAITVTERDTGKVIRQIPSEDLQNLYTKLGQLTGIVFNHPA